MREIYKIYYRNYGVRYAVDMITAKKQVPDHLSRDAIYHVHGDADTDPNPNPNHSFFGNYSKKILFQQVVDYVSPIGSYRKPPFMLNEVSRPWRRANVAKWQIEEAPWTKATSPDQLVVINYGYLDKAYRYLEVMMTPYHVWHNRWKTIFSTMNTIAGVSQRQHFVDVPVPQYLQGKAILDRFAVKEMNPTIMKIFGSSDPNGFMQLELWKWILPETRDKSLLNLIDKKHYSKINFIFTGKTGTSVVINLGYLNSWIKDQPNTTEMASILQVPAVMVQKLVLKFFMVMNNATGDDESGEIESQGATVVKPKAAISPEGDIENEDEATLEEEGYIESQSSDTDIEEKSVVGPIFSPVAKSTDKPVGQDVSQEAIEQKLAQMEANNPISATAEVFKQLEDDLAALDKISAVQLKNKGIQIDEDENEIPEKELALDPEAIKAEIFELKSPSERLAKAIAEDAEANIITASEYRTMRADLQKYEESTDPYGSGVKRKEFMVVKPEDIQITKEDAAIPVSDAVADKNMAESTLKAFDVKYIKSVMRKDILASVDALQNAGVVIRNHEIEIDRTILGGYERHRLEVKPIDGKPSTISFTLPIVNKDGTLEAGNNKYLMRKQRFDLPIRKIAPSIVGLSTYYGKTFVQTSPKVSNSDVTWLIRQIGLAIVTEGSFIHSVAPGNVFVNEIEQPFIYGAIAENYEKLSAGQLNLYFNYHGRNKYIDETKLKFLERNGRMFCGYIGTKIPVVVDKDDRFIAVGDTEKILGDIYDVLQLPREKAPINFSEIRVFSKYIPVGIVLGYYIGFKKLLAVSNAKYRTVPARKNKDLQPREFAIVFKDQSYIIDGSDRKTALLLAGFNDYEKSIKQYESDLFDHKDVYLNLFMAKGLGSLYVRELDMMENCFVDPISREILESMNEPQTFKGLLFRANELLLTYHHPVSQDRNSMRERGYERFAGAVYKELIKATRQFRNKNMAGRSKIDISPYEVWNSIMKDNSLKIVEDINPIQNLKESEVVTFSGEGGRDKDTMTKPTRAYHISSVGIDSESTVDSTGVGTIFYTSANPQLKNVRGMAAEEKNLTSVSMMSTAAILSPASSTDN